LEAKPQTPPKKNPNAPLDINTPKSYNVRAETQW